jgi:RNA polymerase sigma-70 factor, ECF subfamily
MFAPNNGRQTMMHAAAQTLDARNHGEINGFGAGAAFERALDADAKIEPRELEQYRSQLTKYATWLLGSRAAAEDAVQDTLLAALNSIETFRGRSSVRTWLFGVLKHKVTDTFRRRAREVPLEDDSDDGCGDSSSFTQDGHWRKPPSNWGDPEAALSEKRFFEKLAICIDRLPKNTARVFTMREVLGMETREICDAVGITQENCFVMLHRARMALRQRLEQDWFGQQCTQ